MRFCPWDSVLGLADLWDLVWEFGRTVLNVTANERTTSRWHFFLFPLLYVSSLYVSRFTVLRYWTPNQPLSIPGSQFSVPTHPTIQPFFRYHLSNPKDLQFPPLLYRRRPPYFTRHVLCFSLVSVSKNVRFAFFVLFLCFYNLLFFSSSTLSASLYISFY